MDYATGIVLLKRKNIKIMYKIMDLYTISGALSDVVPGFNLSRSNPRLLLNAVQVHR
jgi:hypothetical protein